MSDPSLEERVYRLEKIVLAMRGEVEQGISLMLKQIAEARAIVDQLNSAAASSGAARGKARN